MFSPAIEKLIKLFSKFPTVGPRTAARFVFYLIEETQQETEELIKAMQDLKNNVKVCSDCFKSFEPGKSEDVLCSICSDTRRNKEIVCVVEKEIDLEAIEKAGSFKGVFFILGKTLSAFKKEQAEIEEKIEILIEKIKNSQIKEVILALNPTPEGRNTILFLKRKLEVTAVLITQLGLGLPLGGEMEYADEETLNNALINRGRTLSN